jgi:hypothetical protein
MTHQYKFKTVSIVNLKLNQIFKIALNESHVTVQYFLSDYLLSFY